MAKSIQLVVMRLLRILFIIVTVCSYVQLPLYDWFSEPRTCRGCDCDCIIFQIFRDVFQLQYCVQSCQVCLRGTAVGCIFPICLSTVWRTDGFPQTDTLSLKIKFDILCPVLFALALWSVWCRCWPWFCVFVVVVWWRVRSVHTVVLGPWVTSWVTESTVYNYWLRMIPSIELYRLLVLHSK